MINGQVWLRYASFLAVLLNVAAVGVHYYLLHEKETVGVLRSGHCNQAGHGNRFAWKLCDRKHCERLSMSCCEVYQHSLSIVPPG